jgi:hypothetical protein
MSLKLFVLVGLLIALICLAGCGSESEDERPTVGAVSAKSNGRTAPDVETPDGDSGAGEQTTAEPEPSDQPLSKSAEEKRTARLLDRIREADKVEPSEELGCDRFTVNSVQGPYSSIGPPPPRVEAKRTSDGVLVSYHFSSVPANDTCRPFGLYLTVWGGRGHGPSNESSTVDVQLHGSLSGKRVVDYPLAGGPPYHVTVSSVAINGRTGPDVTVPVP